MKYLYFVLVLAGLAYHNCLSQNFKTIRPEIGKKISYTATEQKEWSRNIDLLNKINKGELSYQSLSDQDQRLIDSLEMIQDGPITQGQGCSWYCGGGPYKILSSSALDNSKYKADNIHDFNLFTGWVEGKSDYGIGEYIEFYFKPNSPRINKIIIYNGYFKNQDLWESNSRIKKAKLYINNKVYAFLEFQDVNAPHSFAIEPVRSTIENRDLVLKIEIVEVYKGTKYADVVVSEINFDGLDVHCFAKGTKVRMADNSLKSIEYLKVGESIGYFYFETGEIRSAEIEKLEKVVHHDLVRLRFENGAEVITTQDHPFFLKNKGWASLQPEKSKPYKGFEEIHKIEIEDYFVAAGGTVKLISVEFLEGDQETYTISKLSTGDNFIVNGLIVGIEEIETKGISTLYDR